MRLEEAYPRDPLWVPSNAHVQLRGGRGDRLEEPVLSIPDAERET